MKLHRVKVLSGTHHRGGHTFREGDVLEVSTHELGAYDSEHFTVLTGVPIEPEQLLIEEVQARLDRGEKVRAMVKPGLHHRTGADRLEAGDIFMVSAVEVKAFGDKFVFLAEPVRKSVDWNQQGRDIVDGIAEGVPVIESRSGETKNIAGGMAKVTHVVFNATKGALDLAHENGVDITLVTGSGKDGRIVKSDVKDYMAEFNNIGEWGSEFITEGTDGDA